MAAAAEVEIEDNQAGPGGRDILYVQTYLEGLD